VVEEVVLEEEGDAVVAVEVSSHYFKLTAIASSQVMPSMLTVSVS
jgi:hypothetical protein